MKSRSILRLAVPSIVSNITVPLLGLCDVTIMGHVGGATHIAAIAVGSMIFNVMYWLFGFLRMGTSGLTAQAYGRQSNGDLAPSPQSILRQSLLTAVAIGLLFVVVQVPLKWLTFWLMHPTAEVARLCTPYYYICIWGAPAMLGLYALTGWFIGMQDTRTPMVIAIGQNIVNIALSLFLVLALGLGVRGVALGTLIAQWAGFLMAIGFLASKYRLKVPKPRFLLSASTHSEHGSTPAAAGTTAANPTRTVLRSARLCRSALPRTLSTLPLRLYADIFLRTLCLVAVNFYFTARGAAQGADILAANTLLMQLFTLFSYVMDGFAYAGEALAGRYYGAGDTRQLLLTVRHLFYWGVAMVLIFTAVYWIGGTPFLRLLTTDDAVVITAARYLPWAVLIPLAGMAAFVWDGVFIGMTASRGMLWACLIAAVAFFAIELILSPALGNHALWIALLVYLALRGIVQTVLFVVHEHP